MPLFMSLRAQFSTDAVHALNQDELTQKYIGRTAHGAHMNSHIPCTGTVQACWPASPSAQRAREAARTCRGDIFPSSDMRDPRAREDRPKSRSYVKVDISSRQ